MLKCGLWDNVTEGSVCVGQCYSTPMSHVLHLLDDKLSSITVDVEKSVFVHRIGLDTEYLAGIQMDIIMTMTFKDSV